MTRKKQFAFVCSLVFIPFVTAITCGLCVFAAFPSANSHSVQSTVLKNELSTTTSNEEIAQILIERMMDRHMIGNWGWTTWIHSYYIHRLSVGNLWIEGPTGKYVPLNTEIYVKPLISDSWRDIWTFEVNDEGNGWVGVGYYMIIYDRQDHYELCGPYTGG